jgi:hypothetical protein
MTLPVLDAHGHEITADFLLQQIRTNSGKAIYVAWIEPLTDKSSDATETTTILT